MKQEQELLTIATTAVNSRLAYRWAIGREGSRFLAEIRDNRRLTGIKCSKCGRVYVPPRKVCGPCFATMDHWVSLGDEGVLETLSLVNYKFIDPNTGEQRHVPYVYGYIRPDGADTMLSHFVQSAGLSDLKPGIRVRAVFKEDRRGSLDDILYFEPIEWVQATTERERQVDWRSMEA